MMRTMEASSGPCARDGTNDSSRSISLTARQLSTSWEDPKEEPTGAEVAQPSPAPLPAYSPWSWRGD